jgi:replicative DNA helicase
VLKSCEAIAVRTDFDPDEHLDLIRKRVEDATAYAGSTALRPQSEIVLEVLEAVEQGIDPGLSTGYPDLDDAIGGLRPGELIVIGARPGVGKSVLGMCVADHVSTRLGLPVLFASLEMRQEELTHRRIAATATVPLTHLTRHTVTDADWNQISRAQDRLTASQLRVDDTPGVSLAQVRGQLRGMYRTGCAARLLVGDYLGIFAAPKADSRQQAVAELARGFKLIAREFGIPVILLAQLNRSLETRSDKRPVMSDLRESGEVEAAADIVILLHREDAYEPESPRAGEIDLIVSKNRQGALTTVTLTFQGHYGRIVSLGPECWSPSRSAE